MKIYRDAMGFNDWAIEEETGYVPKTTFYHDFSIADVLGGKKAVIDTFKDAFEAWKDNVEYITEFVMDLNWKIWEHFFRHDKELQETYEELYWKAERWCEENLKGDDLSYFYRTTD